jgi:GT2 family glycosyltransferase
MSQSLRVSRLHIASFVDQIVWSGLRAAASLRNRSPWLAAQLRRCVLLGWWTVTLQLHTHARYWLRARRLRRAEPPETAAQRIATPDPATLTLPCSDDPVVSVIVPTYGQTGYTLRCLASLIQHWPDVPIEIIVVDDAWTGPDAAVLAMVTGIRLIRNDTNLGYLRSCNKAAAAARGAYLYLLNNDTQVRDDWLDPMLSLLVRRADVGAVGAKLLYPDGRLQEAGAIIWRDASGWNFGRLDDPSKPIYNYVREVDYCSAAALLVRRSEFLAIGGFDERYAPAYFEDADLSFRLRRLGLKTLYQPASRIVHFEGVSHGRDTDVGGKSYQLLNRGRFIAAWAPVLAAEHYPNGQNILRARDRAHGRKVVLVVDHLVPQPDRDAGSRTMFGFLMVLRNAGFVVKFWPHNLSYSPGYTEVLQGLGIEVFHGPSQAGFDAWIRQFGNALDCILLSRPDVTDDVIRPIRQHSKARVLYYGHDLHFARMRRQAEVSGDERLLRAAERMEVCERSIWRQVDLSLYPSEEEADIACALQPDCGFQAVVPYGFDEILPPRPAPEQPEIIFVAGFAHTPNQDAACWFSHQVMPLIRAACPQAYLSIIGSNPTDNVLALASEAIHIHPNVSDDELAAAYGRARVAVVPLRSGAGVKLKVVEALRTGVPLVTTPVGAQGLPGVWQIVSVEDEPEAFAAAVVSLLRDDAAWAARNAAQLDFAAERFSVAAMAESLLRAVDPPPASRRRAA